MELDFVRLSQRAELLGELPSAIVALREVRETLKVIHEMQQSARETQGPSVRVRIIHVGGFGSDCEEFEEAACAAQRGRPGAAVRGSDDVEALPPSESGQKPLEKSGLESRENA